MTQMNRQWLLKRRPHGMVTRDDFDLREAADPRARSRAGAGPGARAVPELRSRDARLDGRRPELPAPGRARRGVRAPSVGQVIRSSNPDLPVGCLVQGMFGWQEYALGDPAAPFAPRRVPDGTPPTMPLSIFGGTSLTAYFGLLDVGQPQAGETVVVSGAAGATGSVAGQIAKIKGCRVIGIAGGKDKCDWLLGECGFDAVIDYKRRGRGRAPARAVPEGHRRVFRQCRRQHPGGGDRRHRQLRAHRAVRFDQRLQRRHAAAGPPEHVPPDRAPRAHAGLHRHRLHAARARGDQRPRHPGYPRGGYATARTCSTASRTSPGPSFACSAARTPASSCCCWPNRGPSNRDAIAFRLPACSP